MLATIFSSSPSRWTQLNSSAHFEKRSPPRTRPEWKTIDRAAARRLEPGPLAADYGILRRLRLLIFTPERMRSQRCGDFTQCFPQRLNAISLIYIVRDVEEFTKAPVPCIEMCPDQSW